MNESEVRAQSESAYKQWCEQWREHAKIHNKPNHKDLEDYRGYGVGKAMLLVANGASFEKNINIIKKYQGLVDVMVCDKTLGHCLDNDIIPKFCLLADANVSYEKYMEKWSDKLKDTVLCASVCANPKWTQNGNWKDIYMFVNKDILNSEREFSRLSGCHNYIAAGTNVSNAMLIFATQCENDGKQNFFGYDKYLLIGFDYSWPPGGNYYSFNANGDGKHNYMRHVFGVNANGKLCYSSNNLVFSAKWLDRYVRAFDLPVVQCTKDSILETGYYGDLRSQIKYCYKPDDSKKVNEMYRLKKRLVERVKELEKTFNEIKEDHYLSFISSV